MLQFTVERLGPRDLNKILPEFFGRDVWTTLEADDRDLALLTPQRPSVAWLYLRCQQPRSDVLVAWGGYVPRSVSIKAVISSEE